MVIGSMMLTLNDETEKTVGAHLEGVFVLGLCQEGKDRLRMGGL
jgi:hypothetical protein